MLNVRHWDCMPNIICLWTLLYPIVHICISGIWEVLCSIPSFRLLRIVITRFWDWGIFLDRNSQCSLGWPRTLDLLALASLVLGFQAGTATPVSQRYLKIHVMSMRSIISLKVCIPDIYVEGIWMYCFRLRGHQTPWHLWSKTWVWDGQFFELDFGMWHLWTLLNMSYLGICMDSMDPSNSCLVFVPNLFRVFGGSVLWE